MPIGIIDVNWGGTRIEPWMASEGLELVPEFKQQLMAKQEALKNYLANLNTSLTEATPGARSPDSLLHIAHGPSPFFQRQMCSSFDFRSLQHLYSCANSMTD